MSELKFHPLRPFDESFFKTANLRVSVPMVAKCSPEQLMATLAADSIWTEWAPMLKRVEWTSERGLNATRTVYLAGNQAVKEVFFIWKENQQVAFYVDEATINGIEAFGENYEISVLPDGRTQLIWTVAIEVSGIGKLFIPVSRFFMRLTFKRWLKKYAQLLEQGRWK